MSGDLLGLFDAPSEAPKQPQQNSASSGSHISASNTDPFSFFQPTTAPTQSQGSVQDTQWTSIQTQQPSTGNIWVDLSGLGKPAAKPALVEDEEDGWGDFEAPVQESSPQPPATVQTQTRPITRIVRAPTIDLLSNNLLSLDSSPPKSSKLESLTERPSWESSLRQSTESRPKQADPNVLFDADDFDEGALPDDDDEDDFGDFEGPAEAPAAAPVSVPLSVDLMSGDLGPSPVQGRSGLPSQLLSTLSIGDGPSLYPQPPKSPSFQERNPFPGLGLKTPVDKEFPKETKPRSPSPVTAWPTFVKGEEPKAATEKNSFEAEWGAIDDEPPKPVTRPAVKPAKPAPTKPSAKTTTKDNPPASSDWEWDDWGTSNDPAPTQKPTAPASPVGPPPTNIPPPSVLLSIFPSLLGTASTSLLKPTATASLAVKDRVHSSPTTITFLRGFLALATVAARIIAGRGLRWHRDKFLSQSMSISSATGGKGGMKLAGIDKSQSAREDREAGDVVDVWKDQIVGRLRTAVAAANAAVAKDAALGRQMKVPELAEVMRVETVKGAITAPKACVVCGLKREERVVRVDFEVEDSFGEWWVEHWGHRECRNFWVEHEVALRSR